MTETAPIAEIAAGLRALADMIENNPQIDPAYLYGEYHKTHVWWPRTAAELAEIARAAKAAGATVEKQIRGDSYNLAIRFGAVTFAALGSREDVCERVVTGVETVTKQVPDPSAPLVEVTETVEKVEWVCRPLLAAEAAS